MPPAERFKFLGIEVPLPKWGVWGVAAVAVVGFGAWMYAQLRADLFDAVSVPRAQMVQLEEMQKHFAEVHESETPIKRDVKDVARIRLYKSDGCLYVGRLSDDGSIATTTYVPDPNKIPKEKPPEIESTIRDGGLLSTPAYAQNCGGRCLNHHPGQFNAWYGERRGDWVQLWRQWPEGCTHFQWWNLAYNYGDSNPDGTARVTWTCCVPH